MSARRGVDAGHTFKPAQKHIEIHRSDLWERFTEDGFFDQDGSPACRAKTIRKFIQ
jgi:hypothetical protein